MMNNLLLNILVTLGVGALTAFISAFYFKGKNLFDFEKNQENSENLIKESRIEAEKIKNETKEYVQKVKESIEHYTRTKEERIKKIEQSLNNKDDLLNKREKRVQEVKLELASQNEELQTLQELNKRIEKSVIDKLSAKTGKSIEKLKEELIENYIKQLEAENSDKINRHEEILKENADKIARRIVVSIIQRLCSPTSVETRAVTINVPKDFIKGKIVGKDAMNIRAFEEELDVDVVFNDLPNTISVSAFNLVQRRIAQVAIQKLIEVRGDITPEIVKKTIKEAEKETDDELYQIGKTALDKMGIEHDNKEFIRTVGRLKYRTSYGQNIMKHSMEVGFICRMLGNEIGANEKTCLIAGFLHDIGKAIDQDPNVKDCHDLLTKEIMEKHGFTWEEVHAAWVHHDAEPQQTPEALLVKAADAISASRPGARQESFEKYLERIHDLEVAAVSFTGVKKAFAISAGREVRVIVEPDKVNDKDLTGIAKGIAEKIEDEIVYPGKIKVNVIRKTKYTQLTK